MLGVSAPTFADLLREYRRAAGLTQEALAERASLSVHGIQKLERGTTHPYRDTAQRLATALRLEPEAETRFRAAVRPVRRRGSILGPQSTARPARHNLPVALSSLVGREQEQAEVTARLAGARLLTLTGIGGCGKTRLALEVARNLIDSYPDGVWLVELGPLTDSALVAHQVAAVLGVREGPQEPVLAALASALAGRRLLLVLDNCEHLLQACAVLTDAMLRSCPDVQVLATSREPIGISGEVAWRVPSLAIPDPQQVVSLTELARTPAVLLFVERGSAAQARFALSGRNAKAVAQVCHRLDGIPLALELAAGRLEALSVEQLAARLDQRFLLLTGGSRAALPRQQTLVATLDWSYDLLSKPERHLLERVAVFAGTWTLEAAEAVCASRDLAAEDVLDLLSRLVRKSLVVVGEAGDGAKRFELLETVRDYARQKQLARGNAETTAVRERHAAYYSALADRLHPTMTNAFVGWLSTDPTLTLARRRFEEVQHDLRLALAWWLDTRRRTEGLTLAVTLSAFWTWFGLYAEAHHCLEPALNLAGSTVPSQGGLDGVAATVSNPLWARALWMVGAVAYFQGKYAEACPYLRASAERLREGGDRLLLGHVLNQLGMSLWLVGDVERAANVLDESLGLSREQGDTITRAGALRNVGMVARFQGDYERATALLRESLAQAKLAPFRDGWSVARGLSNLARVAYLQGELQHARTLVSQTFEVIQGSQFAGAALADALEVLGAVDVAEGSPGRGATLFGAAEAQWRASGGSRFPPDQPDYERAITSIRALLDGDTYALAWTAGQAMTAKHAIKYACSEAVSRGLRQ